MLMLVGQADGSQKRTAPNDAEVREAISGSLCRCTGEKSIVAGVMVATERTR
jgi:aerobic-type carbon monoxide dehydrogenase small subunit (CoxS/CutS family)